MSNRTACSFRPHGSRYALSTATHFIERAAEYVYAQAAIELVPDAINRVGFRLNKMMRNAVETLMDDYGWDDDRRARVLAFLDEYATSGLVESRVTFDIQHGQDQREYNRKMNPHFRPLWEPGSFGAILDW